MREFHRIIHDQPSVFAKNFAVVESIFKSSRLRSTKYKNELTRLMFTVLKERLLCVLQQLTVSLYIKQSLVACSKKIKPHDSSDGGVRRRMIT